MKHNEQIRKNEGIPESVESVARQDGVLDFKDEGVTDDGLPVGKLTLRGTSDPVYADGRWVTLGQALRIAKAWGIEVNQY